MLPTTSAQPRSCAAPRRGCSRVVATASSTHSRTRDARRCEPPRAVELLRGAQLAPPARRRQHAPRCAAALVRARAMMSAAWSERV